MNVCPYVLSAVADCQPREGRAMPDEAEKDYTREDMVRAWEEGHEVCEWPGCSTNHPNPYGEFRRRVVGSITHGTTGLTWDRTPSNYAEQRALLDDSLRNIPSAAETTEPTREGWAVALAENTRQAAPRTKPLGAEPTSDAVIPPGPQS